MWDLRWSGDLWICTQASYFSANQGSVTDAELRLVNGTRFPIIYFVYCHKPELVRLPYPIPVYGPEVALRYEERISCKPQATCTLAPSPLPTHRSQTCAAITACRSCYHLRNRLMSGEILAPTPSRVTFSSPLVPLTLGHAHNDSSSFPRTSGNVDKSVQLQS